VGPTAGLDRCGKSRPPPGFNPRTAHPVACRYTDYATRPTVIHIRSLFNSIIDNVNKCTSIKIYTFTYNPLILLHVSIFLTSYSGNLTSNNHTQNTDELRDRLTFYSLKIVDIIKFIEDVQNWSISCEYHRLIELQVFISRERQLYVLITSSTVDSKTYKSVRL
jgi:hypothetical protein